MKAWGSRLLSLAVAVGFCLALDAFFGNLHQEYLSRMVFLAGLYVILSVSLNIINGICGQFSIGHAAFYQIGAYATGYLTATYFADPRSNKHFALWLEQFLVVMRAHPLLWLVVLMVVGAVATGIVGIVVGLPSLKLRGDYLAIVTLGFGEIIRIATINVNEIGGAYGLQGIVKIHPLWLVWLLAIACIAVSRNLLKSAHGLTFLAVREDEVAASAMGVNTTKTKVVAFILGSMFAGAAGVLFAHHEGFITPDNFKMEISFIILTMVVIGGTGSITGSTLAGIALFSIPEYLRDAKSADGIPLTVTSAALIATMISVVVAVAAFKRIEARFHGSIGKRIGLYAGAVLGAAIVQKILSLGLSAIPKLAETTYEVSRLRMVIFAGTLIIVMLLRPQGVLAHHEFSWTWLKKVLTRLLNVFKRKEAVA